MSILGSSSGHFQPYQHTIGITEADCRLATSYVKWDLFNVQGIASFITNRVKTKWFITKEDQNKVEVSRVALREINDYCPKSQTAGLSSHGSLDFA